ncbi:MAG: hypothetical protein JWM27_1201 [Gemmatimonadetes bacterium]|nr:hypothetical protein [Gemmatimonadota bacterium]
MLPSLHLHAYRARLRTLAPLAFTGFPGPALRGALGDDPEVYARLLAPPPTLPQKRFSDPPRPLLLRPRFGAGEYGEGSALELDFTLVGRAGAHLPAVVRALARLGERGVGEGRHAGLGRFEVERVDALGPGGASAAVVSPQGMFRPVSLPWSYPDHFSAGPKSIDHPFRLRLETPTFVNAHGLARGSLHLGDVVVDLLRRLSLFAQAYGDGPVHSRDEERAWERAAAGTRIADASLRWVAVHRFSRKQQRAMEFGGWLGWVEYDAEAAAWLPLLRAARLLHVGKHTAFGFGAARADARRGAQ